MRDTFPVTVVNDERMVGRPGAGARPSGAGGERPGLRSAVEGATPVHRSRTTRRERALRRGPKRWVGLLSGLHPGGPTTVGA